METKKTLRFRPDGTFKIVQFTDVHWQESDEADAKTKQVMEQVLDVEKPDFVMFTGDVIFSCMDSDGNATCSDPLRSLREAVASVVERHIPWSLVFGNHDSEFNITRQALMEEAMRLPYSLCEAGPTDIAGVGNYVMPVWSKNKDKDEEAALLYGIDSGEYSDHPLVGGYAWIKQNQIQWYIEQSQAWQAKCNGATLPALAFFHIPLPEYQMMWQRATCYGQKQEDICAPYVQSGLFTAMLEQGDVMATFCGHDHINDFYGKYYGIGLYYGRATGHNTYGRDGMLRGARVISLTEGERQIQSWLRLGDGSLITEQPQHLPEQ
ncbi:metallophosphoesterase family protein [Paenibacillus yanchengensis]|uniref:Metallophosphoesterase family protein n=1 Tax=Paenibacillus yanchengensis TaxID=2035833 RepID=A0ABW4YNZ8_9BACL